MTVTLQKSPYLPRQRNFPNDNSQALGIELDKAYIDIASRVNERTIGFYSLNLPSITGNQWYIQAIPQPTLRQVFTFTGATLVFNHGINVSQIGGFVQIYGTFTDGTNWYPLPYVIAVGSVANQVAIYVSPTQVVITKGAGAPAIVSGTVVLEWLSLAAQNSNA